MKKTLLLSALLIMMTATLASCDPDDDYYYYDAPFLGSWMRDDGSSTFTFYDNGTGVFTSLYNGAAPMSFTWDADDYYLTVYPNDGWGDEWNYQWQLYGNNLTLYDLDNGGTLYYYAY